MAENRATVERGKEHTSKMIEEIVCSSGGVEAGLRCPKQEREVGEERGCTALTRYPTSSESRLGTQAQAGRDSAGVLPNARWRG